MTSRKSITLLLLALWCSAAVVVGAYLIGERRARSDIESGSERQLHLIALNLESVLEKFETLPFVVAFQPEVTQALATPENKAVVHRLNLILQAIQRQAKVSAIYLMDREGNTLASSNWDEPLTFVGRNFSFRPYFYDALKGDAGRFYGIGNATGEPGYFIAQPVYPAAVARGKGRPAGVIAVKISLSEFEETWRSSEDPIALVDKSKVVFLSNRADWKYHSTITLDAIAQRDLADTLQYAGRKITPIRDLPMPMHAGFGESVSQPIGRLGWQLMLFPSHARIERSATLTALASALLLAIAGISSWALYQRRRRMEERMASRKALQQAAEELDRRIAQSTEALLQANQTLEVKYAKLKETEHILRSTQNELVQAGKLAMLGQMAAGMTHELNQPLTAIRAFADNAVTFLARGQVGPASENLTHISAASGRMGAIIGQLKGFARKSHETLSAVDLAQSIRASAALLESEFHRNDVTLEMDVPSPITVVGDAVRIEQVLINLMRNAIDAVEGAATKRVSIRLQRQQDDAVIAIRDSGGGIPEQVAQHLFEPFFTTKPSGRGLGLGLAISSSIVQAMNGQLSAHSPPGSGAEFVVRLPLQRTETRAAKGEQLVSM
jgi:two-component system C4-dicarboxylate transport sensor histidine kinase DctB